MTPTALIMAGGTGGHVVPALSIAKALQAQGWQVQWLGSPKGIENDLVPKAGIVLHRLTVSGLRGKSKASLLLAPFQLMYALGQAMGVIKRTNAQLVIGLGGFASGPGGLAAKLLGKPLVIHEQNAIAGKTNRWLHKWAKLSFQAFEGALPGASTVGNPIRQELVAKQPKVLPEPMGRPYRVLILGGSLGALAINQLMPKVFARLAGHQLVEIWHQSGQAHLQATQEQYRSAGVQALVVPFIDDMARAYDWADLVVCRAGALTVSEVSACGLPAVFIPFPFAVDDHQTQNAEPMVKAGAAQLRQQRDLSEETMAELLDRLLEVNTLNAMANASYRLRQVQATETMVKACQQLVGESE